MKHTTHLKWSFLYIWHPISSPIPHTPAFPLAFSLDLHDDVHVLLTEVLDGAFAHVFEIGAAGGDDVDHAEGFCFGVAVAVVMVMVMRMVVVVIVVVAVRMGMGVVMVMAVGMTVSVSMIVAMVMSR